MFIVFKKCIIHRLRRGNSMLVLLLIMSVIFRASFDSSRISEYITNLRKTKKSVIVKRLLNQKCSNHFDEREKPTSKGVQDKSTIGTWFHKINSDFITKEVIKSLIFTRFFCSQNYLPKSLVQNTKSR